MESANQNKWCRPWTTEELRDNAEKWSLAGDVALLNTIKAFSETLLSKTGEISDKIDVLLNNVDEAGLKLDLAQNEFQNLKNTQFIESRVYDDDEALDSKEEEKIIENVISDDEQEKIIINSIKEGMKILNEYYEKLEVSVSDSEEETERSNFCEYILKPKDMYAHRPLPPVIGTDEWYQKWHVDLPSSDSESDKVSDIYSESDSEDNLPKDFIKGSETSSELDFSSHASENRPVASSTFNSSQHVDLESSSMENEDQESLNDKTPVANKSFAEQLAAKLGNIISEQEIMPEEINKRPIQPPKTTNVSGIPFEDEEPPPLDEFEHSILPKNIQTGYFSGGQGLFDDDNDDDEPFWGQSNKPELTKKANSDESKKQSSKLNKGLFDDSGSDYEDGMFSTSKKQMIDTKKYLQPKNLSVGLYDEEPPELNYDNSTTIGAEKDKKPIGGVRLMGSVDIFNDQKISKILKGSATENIGTVEHLSKSIKEDSVAKPKRLNLFDEDDFDDFLDTASKPSVNSYENIQAKGKVNLFDEELEDENLKPNSTLNSSERIIDKNSEGVTKNISDKSGLFDDEDVFVNKPKKVSLFDDDDELFNDDDFFSNIANTKLNSKLFDDIEEKSDNMFDIKNKPNNTKKDLLSEDSDFDYGVDRKKVENLVTKSDLDLNNKPDAEKNNSEGKEIKSDEIGDITQKVTEIKQEKINSVIPKSLDNSTTESNRPKISEVVKKPLSLFDDSDSESENIFTNTTSARNEAKSKEIVDIMEDEDSKTQEIEENLPPNHLQCESYVNTSVDGKTETQDSEIYEQETISVTHDKGKSKNDIPISPFDSVPPPDDAEDWDTKSDSLSDREDYVPYQAEESFSRSSVFDDEPPSLGPNESSGIVRDYSTTRTDTDDSSFFPHASSSRRFSSDIFNEQQSQDSFFVTKNKTESINPASLGVIPEVTQANITDITPSGDLKEFDNSEESQSAKETLHLEEEEQISVAEDDMLPIKKASSGQSENVLSRIAAFEQNHQKDSSNTPVVEPKKGSPGKLKHNLNINVNALRPTLGAPKLKFTPRSHSLHDDETDSNIPKIITKSEPSSTFEGNEGKVEVLHSITKDRVKIPVKRRPSTRRGRLEAIRRSAADLPFDADNYSDEIENNTEASSFDTNTVKEDILSNEKSSRTITTTENTLITENLSAGGQKSLEIQRAKISSTKKDGFNNNQLFVEPAKIRPLSGQTNITKIREKSPFRDPVTKDSGLIGDPVLETNTKITQVKRLTRLFDDDVLDDELFHSSTSTHIKETTAHTDITQSTKDNKAKKQITKLFSDSEDDFMSNFNWAKTKDQNSTIFRGGTDSPDSPKSNDEINTSSKPVSKLFTEQSKDTKTSKDEDSNINEPVTSKKRTNKKIVSFFEESETFPSSEPPKTDKAPSKIKEESNIPQTTTEKTKPNKLFNESDNEIFSNVSKNVIKKKSSRLFGSDDESDGELFKNSSSRVTEQKTVRPKTVLPKSQEYLKKSLFNDSSSDDDLFSSTNKKTGRPRESPILKTQKMYGLRKSENTETTEDPLSKLF